MNEAGASPAGAGRASPHASDPHDRFRAGLSAEIAAFGTGSERSFVHRSPGILACCNPSSPERSFLNSVQYEDAAGLGRALGTLASMYERAGVLAWTVWVPEADREAAELLASAGHVLDASPRAMLLDLEELAPPPPTPQGTRLAACEPGLAGELNDRAYGYQRDAFRAALEGRRNPRLRWLVARLDGEPVSCVGIVEAGVDRVVTGVATLREHRGEGIASWLLHRALEDERRSGARAASLEATKLGAPLYERLGFRDVGKIEMWERRRPRPSDAANPTSSY